jgi:glucose/arabinose dehydrogenase
VIEMTPRRILGIGATLAMLIGLGPLASAGATTAPHRVAAIGTTPVVTGINNPAAFTFAPDGRIFYGERLTGQIRIYNPATHSNTLFFTVPNVSIQGEQGLLGLAIDPKYPAKPYVYAYATRSVGGLHDQIVKITDVGGTGSNMTIIWSGDTVAGQYHDGGRILFGPDGKLYAVQGEAHDSSNAQDLTNDAGKILRMNRKGQVPKNNPFTASLIWSYGHRNSFGFNFDPLTGYLWETENGPECNDEINFIKKGRNYAWGPHETCSTPPAPPANTNQDGPNRVFPLLFYTPTIAPTGAAFCVGCGLSGSDGALFFGAYNDHNLRRVILTADRKHVMSSGSVYTHPQSILSVERGPDKLLYLSDPQGIYMLVNA